MFHITKNNLTDNAKCFFKAVAEIFCCTWQHIFEEAAKELLSNPEKYAGFITIAKDVVIPEGLSEQELQTFKVNVEIKRCANKGWADHEWIQAVANRFQINVLIHRTGQSAGQNEVTPDGESCGQIELNYNGYHYTAKSTLLSNNNNEDGDLQKAIRLSLEEAKKKAEEKADQEKADKELAEELAMEDQKLIDKKTKTDFIQQQTDQYIDDIWGVGESKNNITDPFNDGISKPYTGDDAAIAEAINGGF